MVSSRKHMWRRWIATVLRVLLSGVFVVSAVAKLVSIDQFELYVYSYGLFSLNVAYVVARLCIVVELLVGIGIGVGWWSRVVRLSTLGLLIFFSLFLCYAALVGREESCQCFGQWVDFSPMQSLLKNALLIVLVLVYYKWEREEVVVEQARLKKRRQWGAVAIAVGCVSAVFCISVPDNWMFGRGAAPKAVETLESVVAPQGELGALGLAEGHRVLAFVTPECPYCKMARQKLGSMAARHGIAQGRIVYFQPGVPDGNYAAIGEHCYEVRVDLFGAITHGSRPYIVLMEEGKAVKVYHYRNISEREIVQSLMAGQSPTTEQ